MFAKLGCQSRDQTVNFIDFFLLNRNNHLFVCFSVKLFTGLWPELSATIDGFLFSKVRSAQPLNADERKRHEYVDCLLIELIRTEILPYAAMLPYEFMQKIIDILNRGSINTLDIHDVMGNFCKNSRTRRFS